MTWKVIKEKSLIILLLIGLFVLNQGPIILAALLAKKGNVTPIESVAVALLQLFCIALFIYIARRNKIAFTQKVPIGKMILIALVAFVVVRLINVLGLMVMSLEGNQQLNNQDTLMNLTQRIPLVNMILFAIFGAPIMEEIMFRGIIPKMLFKNHFKIGLVVGSILFGLAHGVTSLGAFIIYAGMGAVFALIYYKTDHLENAMAAHFLNNLVAFAALVLLM